MLKGDSRQVPGIQISSQREKVLLFLVMLEIMAPWHWIFQPWSFMVCICTVLSYVPLRERFFHVLYTAHALSCSSSSSSSSPCDFHSCRGRSRAFVVEGNADLVLGTGGLVGVARVVLVLVGCGRFRVRDTAARTGDARGGLCVLFMRALARLLTPYATITP